MPNPHSKFRALPPKRKVAKTRVAPSVLACRHPGARPGRPQWLNAQWLVHPEGRVGVRKIERFREWIHEELAMERERTPSELWEPL